MKIPKTIASVIVGSFLLVGLAFAAPDAKPASTEAHASKCCAKAEKDGKACGHECCAAAAKEGKNCEKCGGAGKMADNKKAEPKH